MTRLLEKVFDRAARLPEEEQNSIASWLLAEIEAERRWSAAFARSGEQLAALAEQARRQDAAGETEPLDPDSL